MRAMRNKDQRNTEGIQEQVIAPLRTLSLIDGVALIVGMVIGTGIFKTPSLVAANTGTDGAFFIAWLLGGIISLIGALCYAELAITYPHAGGDYHFLTRAFGRNSDFSQATVITMFLLPALNIIISDTLVKSRHWWDGPTIMK